MNKTIGIDIESIENNCVIKVDGEVLNPSVLNYEEKEQFYYLLNKIQKPGSWKPKEGEHYFRYDSVYGIMESVWSDESEDFADYAVGNCYPTIEEADFALEKLKVEIELKRYIQVNDPIKVNWKNHSNKYYLTYSYNNGKINRYSAISRQNQGALYFSSKLDWENMIETIGEDRIKKYIFGVE
jgi:hypothetical protein